jgi:hypothetical protein
MGGPVRIFLGQDEPLTKAAAEMLVRREGAGPVDLGAELVFTVPGVARSVHGEDEPEREQ